MGMRSKLRFWLCIFLCAAGWAAEKPVAPLSGEDFARYLHGMPANGPVDVTMRDVAELGEAGRVAGPEVMRFLSAPDESSRLAAARALGYIGYQPAAPALRQALNDPVDVRLNWIAAESLGRLRNPDSNEALQKVADEHWYPPVRVAAAKALRHIRNGEPYTIKRDFPLEFFRYLGLEGDFFVCHSLREGGNPYGERRDYLGVHDPVQLQKLRYRYDRLEQRPEGLADMKYATPTVALKVDGGWLTGSDRGEWGGELVFIRDDGKLFPLLYENVFDVFRFWDRVFVVTGLAHMGFNSGGIYTMASDPSGRWNAVSWRTLPLAPRNVRIEHDDLRIELFGGDTILVSPDGKMRMAPCQPSPP